MTRMIRQFLPRQVQETSLSSTFLLTLVRTESPRLSRLCVVTGGEFDVHGQFGALHRRFSQPCDVSWKVLGCATQLRTGS